MTTIKAFQEKFHFRAAQTVLVVLCVLSLAPGDAVVQPNENSRATDVRGIPRF
jgi:hypothetical protein